MKNNRWAVVGMGETGKVGKTIKANKIACNDTNRMFPDRYDYTFTVDSVNRFDMNRRTAIVNSPGMFVSYKQNWGQWRKIDIEIGIYQGGLRLPPQQRAHTIDLYHASIISPYVAAQFAYYRGADEIVLCGVDMVTHHMKAADRLERIKTDFAKLYKQMRGNGVKLCIADKFGVLRDVLPVFEEYQL